MKAIKLSKKAQDIVNQIMSADAVDIDHGRIGERVYYGHIHLTGEGHAERRHGQRSRQAAGPAHPAGGAGSGAPRAAPDHALHYRGALAENRAAAG